MLSLIPLLISYNFFNTVAKKPAENPVAFGMIEHFLTKHPLHTTYKNKKNLVDSGNKGFQNSPY